ncbi:MAG: DUF2357 domain-containing protein [Bacilli bacterium]|nr:DUF2357 domain-containing protein [Bacilli bacterium]
MNNELKVLDLYTKTSTNKINSFNNSVRSEFTVSTNVESFETNFEWLELMEETIVYIDNILRNPNRFIINEEEVVNIEKARRVTVESIKHLARNTSMIQKIEKNGDVKPSKILNINKDENYNTYENRLIYTLIKNMQLFISMRKRDLVTKSFTKDTKKSEYHGSSRVGSETVDINVSLASRSNVTSEYGRNNDLSVEQRIDKLELQISDLTRTDVYKMLDKANVARVIPPIKKTNLILKNTNFQYAMKLWDFLQTYIDNGNKTTKSSSTIKENVKVKAMFDDVFLLNYLIVNSLGENKEQLKSEKNREVVENLTNNMITKIVELNSDLPMEELQKIIGDRIAVIRNKKEASLEEIQQKINVKIQSAISRIVTFDFRS